MAKYKLINRSGLSNSFWVFNKIYDSDLRRYLDWLSVQDMAAKYPNNWELIKEKSPKELLIEEAKLRYPIGTEFYSALPGYLNPARLKCWGGYRFQEDVHGCKNVIWNKDHNNRECGFLYCNGVWAEIINKEPMCTEKTIKLSLDQAKKMYGKSPEMDKLLLANFSKEELTKKELPKSIFELSPYTGYYIHSGEGNVQKLRSTMNAKADINAKHIFATEKQAKSALAAAQLSQLMAVYNDGWEDSWDGNGYNYCLICTSNRIKKDMFSAQKQFLAFKSAELRDEFLKNFEPLIKEYFMID